MRSIERICLLYSDCVTSKDSVDDHSVEENFLVKLRLLNEQGLHSGLAKRSIEVNDESKNFLFVAV